MLHVIISGFVQGVGFRQFVRYKARKLNLRGWVKNLDDGRVEAMFDGDKNNLDKMIVVLRRGPFLAKVNDINIDWNSEVRIDRMDFEIIK